MVGQHVSVGRGRLIVATCMWPSVCIQECPQNLREIRTLLLGTHMIHCSKVEWSLLWMVQLVTKAQLVVEAKARKL